MLRLKTSTVCRVFCSVLFCISLTATLGCIPRPEPANNSVVGRLTMLVEEDGNLVEYPFVGELKFIGDNEEVAVAAVTPDGDYTVANAPLGTCRLVVTEIPLMWNPPTVANELLLAEEPGCRAQPVLHPQYADPEQSCLRITVRPGRQVIDIRTTAQTR